MRSRCFVTLLSVLAYFLLLGCNNNLKKKNASFCSSDWRGIPIIPLKIHWDTVRYSDEFIDSFSIFSVFYFSNDTTIYLFKSVNNCHGDSILFAVENVEEFKGDYHLRNDGLLIFNIHRVVDSFEERYSEVKMPDSIRNLPNPTDFITDTIKVKQSEKNCEFFYKNYEYKVTHKFMKESFNRLYPLLN